MIPDQFSDQRRDKFKGLPNALPDSYSLGASVFNLLFSDDCWISEYAPFNGFDKFAIILIENCDGYGSAFKIIGEYPVHHIVVVKSYEDDVKINRLHSYKQSQDKILSEDMLGDIEADIGLPRVPGRIGFDKPAIIPTRQTGQVKVSFQSLGIHVVGCISTP